MLFNGRIVRHLVCFKAWWKWKWNRSVASDSLRPCGLKPTRLLHPWDFPGKSTGVGCHCLLQWAGMGEFNSDNHYIYYCWQESLRRNGITLRVNERDWNTVHGCSVKNDRMISLHFQDKPFSITVIQVCAPTTSAKEAGVEWFYEDLLELTWKMDILFITGGVECKYRKLRDTWRNRKVWPWSTKWSRAKANGTLPRECSGHSKHPLPRDNFTHGHHQMVNTKIRLIIFCQRCSQRLKSLYSQQKQDRELTVTQIMNSLLAN